jgi:hypothetical protein
MTTGRSIKTNKRREINIIIRDKDSRRVTIKRIGTKAHED